MNQLTAYCSAKSLNHLLQNQVCFAVWSSPAQGNLGFGISSFT